MCNFCVCHFTAWADCFFVVYVDNGRGVRTVIDGMSHLGDNIHNGEMSRIACTASTATLFGHCYMFVQGVEDKFGRISAIMRYMETELLLTS